jgi:Ca2+/H+ antiporter, TMEM165/GDT1 family
MVAAFTAGLLLITVSELGDKTFFIAMILAMRHPRRWVFVGVVAALAVMTVLSVMLGQVAALLPRAWLHWSEIMLFGIFGLKLLYDASRMQPGVTCAEVEEAKDTIEQADRQFAQKGTRRGIVFKSFVLTFLAEWGDRTQIATIALAASNPPVGVTAGAILGHTICAAIAVVGGRLVAGRLSERVLTFLGGILFIGFGIVAMFEP